MRQNPVILWASEVNPHCPRDRMSDIPSDLLYTEEHEYLRPSSEDGIFFVGITDYAQGELGDVVYIKLPAPTTLVIKPMRSACAAPRDFPVKINSDAFMRPIKRCRIQTCIPGGAARLGTPG